MQSAHRRLELLGISRDQIDEIMETGQANTHLKIRSPISGHINKKYVREGQYVDEGSPLYDVADLSTVWIQAQIYEDDLPFLATEHEHGEAAAPSPEPLSVTATTRASPGEAFQGVLSFIYPHVDQETRTVTVRFELDNPGHKLRPGTTATVRFNVPPRDVPALIRAAQSDDSGTAQRDRLEQGLVLTVPESSVIDTGSQTIVYRQTLPGEYEGVLVALGPRMTGQDDVPYFPVLSGLDVGDIVVTSGSFLVDAETRLNPAAGSIYFGGSSGSGGSASGSTTVRPSTPEDGDAKIALALTRLPEEDRRLAEQQRFCTVLPTSRLGSMGVPVKLVIKEQPVFVCCAGCRSKALANPEATIGKAEQLRSSPAQALK
jgi:Cu(I)/Ag(I) efflux system membrane fusion protein